MSNTEDDKTDWKGMLTGLAICAALGALVMPYAISFDKHKTEDKERYFYPGLVAYQQGHYADAEKDLKQYLAIYTNDSRTLYNLGLCTLSEGKKEEARTDFQASLDNSGSRLWASSCGGRRCDDLAFDMLAWMKANPYWDASQTAVIPPFPVHANLRPR